MFTISLKAGRVIKRLTAAAAAVCLVALAPKIIKGSGGVILKGLGEAANLSTATVIPSGSGGQSEKQLPAAESAAESQPQTEETPQSEQGTSAGTAQTSPTTTTTATTTAKTTATTTAPENAEQKSSGKKLPIKEVQMKNVGTNGSGIWVRNTNSNHTIDISKEFERKPDINIKLKSDQPQVLIVHTHTSECYQASDRGYYYSTDPSRTTDKSKNVVRVADEIEKKLENAGIKTVHVTTFHDYPKYNGAYKRTLETINTYLKKYPSIQVVLDVHRDCIQAKDGTKTKPTAIINGKKAAQVMIISGCDDRGDLNFPDWEMNMRFAVRLQKSMTEKYPGLARPLLFAPFRYNMHATHGSLLLEFGTDANTLDEAVYSAQMVGDCLAEVLTALAKK